MIDAECPLCGSDYCEQDPSCPARASLDCPVKLEPVGADTVRCPGCHALVDVGFELHQHRREHRAMREEAEEQQ